MKKTSTYTMLRDAFEAAMDLEDEYAASGNESDRDHDRKGRWDSLRKDSPPRPSSSSTIGEAEVREIAREVTKRSHEEVL